LSLERRPTVFILTKNPTFAQGFSTDFNGIFSGQRTVKGLTEFLPDIIGTANEVLAIGIRHHKLQPVGGAAKTVGVGKKPSGGFAVEINTDLFLLPFLHIFIGEHFGKIQWLLRKSRKAYQ
jgi:hypothetical protein